MDKVLPLDNVVYYHPGTRVLWRNRPGIVHSLVIKTYKYQVGYNILLDTQSSTDEPKVLNSSYGELVLELNLPHTNLLQSPKSPIYQGIR